MDDTTAPLGGGSSAEIAFLIVGVVLTLLLVGIFAFVLTRKEQE